LLLASSVVPQYHGYVDVILKRPSILEATSQGVAPAGEHPGIWLATGAAQGVASAPAGASAAVNRPPGEFVATLGQGDGGQQGKDSRGQYNFYNAGLYLADQGWKLKLRC
jgi:hypothetical protein